MNQERNENDDAAKHSFIYLFIQSKDSHFQIMNTNER